METKTQRQPKRWTAEEDSMLYEEAMKQASSGSIKDWNRIAEKLPDRTNKDCRKRWINKVCGGLKRGTWSESEDQMLREAVEEYGQKWTKVAQKCDGRSPDQCAKRWQFTLDPKLDRREWTAEEDMLLLRLVKLVGRDWKFICSNHYPTRSRNDLKNRHTILSRRSMSNGSASDDIEVQPLSEEVEARIESAIASGNISVMSAPPSQHPDLDSSSVREADTSSMWINDMSKHHHEDQEPYPEGVSLLDFDMDFQPSANFFEMFPQVAPGGVNGAEPTLVPGGGEVSGSFPATLDFSVISSYNDPNNDPMEIENGMAGEGSAAKEGSSYSNPQGSSIGIDNTTGYNTPLTGVSDGETIMVSGLPSDSAVSKVVLVVEECDADNVKYLIDISKRLRGKVKMEMTL